MRFLCTADNSTLDDDLKETNKNTEQQFNILNVLNERMYAQLSVNVCGQGSIPGAGFW